MKKPLNGDAIARGVILQNQHKIHITGEGSESLIHQIKGWENSNDFNVRKQIAKPSTINITSIILDNLNRWTTSQGTVKKVSFEDEQKNKRFDEVLKTVWHGKSFEDYINSFHKEAIFIEFNGFILVTKPKIIENQIEKEGLLIPKPTGNLSPYMIFISASDVHDFYLTGDKVEYLIIKTSKDSYRLIDDQKDMIFDYDKGKSQILEPQSIPNELGYVPARKISNINEKLLNNQVKTSPIHHVLPSLDRYFSMDADLRMQFIKHLYPKLAIVTKECVECLGTGTIYDKDTKIPCKTCDGSGKVIPLSRDGVIGLPQYLEQSQTAFPGAPATYITPDVDSLKTGLDDLKALKEEIIYSATGDKNLIAESLNTATENTINSRSLEDRIADISIGVEEFEIFIKQAIKDMHKDFASAPASITVKYGRRITSKSESDLMTELKSAIENNMPTSFILGLQRDIVYSKYKNNRDELERQLILVDLEPLAGYTMDQIDKFQSLIDPNDLRLKINFDSLLDTFEANIDIPIQYYKPELDYKKRIVDLKTQLYALLQKQSG